MLSPLADIARLFLKLGTIGFGGPPAHFALMHEEVVVRRRWLGDEAFSEGLAVCEMLPGPASTQMGIYLGYQRAGVLGALVAGTCFIAPAFGMVVGLTWLYFRFQGSLYLQSVFLGISPVVVAIVLAFCWKLGRKTLKDWKKAAISIAVFLATLLSPLSLIVQFLLAGGLGVWLYGPRGPRSPRSLQPPNSSSTAVWLPWFSLPWFSLDVLPGSFLAMSSTVLLAPAQWVDLGRVRDYGLPLGVFFLKVGAMIFGGGLVIIPLLETAVVEQFHWLTHAEFVHGVAIGQVTPGPVVLTAAFVGYKVAGILGAVVATVAIFAPSFGFILLAAPLLQRWQRSPWVRAFLQGVTPAVLGAIGAAVVPLLRGVLLPEDWRLGAIGLGFLGAALVGLLRYQWPTWKLIGVGALLGWGLSWGLLNGR